MWIAMIRPYYVISSYRKDKKYYLTAVAALINLN